MTLAAFSDGFIYCNVLHPISYTMNNVAFDLSQPHYLLMATGPTGDCTLRAIMHCLQRIKWFSLISR